MRLALWMSLVVLTGSQSDHDALQGTWRVVEARYRLPNEPDHRDHNEDGKSAIIFEGDTVTMQELGSVAPQRYAYTLDTLPSPRILRVRQDDGEWRGIYQLNGDTLRLALLIEHYTDKPAAPASFDGQNTASFTFARVRR